MYDPRVGRWLTEDPIGFSAEDVNLYRYVANNATNIQDPSGLIGIFFDGSGYDATAGTIISSLSFPYLVGETEIQKERNPLYIRTNLGNLSKKVDAALYAIEEALKINPGEPVDIFGWSRGGIAAIALAKKLENHKPKPIKVRFMGLIDPTAPVKKYTEDKNFLAKDFRQLGDNVENAAIIQRDGKNDGVYVKRRFYSVFFKSHSVTFSKKTKVLVDKKVPLNHLQTGFDKTVAKEIWNAAIKAGIAFPKWANSPFEEEEWDETPRGGIGIIGNMEKLIRTLKLLD